MIAAAKNHEINLILTKDMSRFGGNTLEIPTNMKLLNDLNPPIAVNFESPGYGIRSSRSRRIPMPPSENMEDAE